MSNKISAIKDRMFKEKCEIIKQTSILLSNQLKRNKNGNKSVDVTNNVKG